MNRNEHKVIKGPHLNCTPTCSGTQSQSEALRESEQMLWGHSHSHYGEALANTSSALVHAVHAHR